MTIINRQPGTEARVEMWVKIILGCDSHMNYIPRFVRRLVDIRESLPRCHQIVCPP